MPERDNSEKKIFSYAEAVALLPEVRRLTEEAYQAVQALPPQAQQEADRIVSAWAYSMLERGIEVKGLWLIDFDNGSGYYCWRHPEPGLHFFHSYEEGFGGRVPIQ
jgi:hypothetical protein